MYVRLAFERSEQQCSMSVVIVVERCRCAILERGGFKLTPQWLIQVSSSFTKATARGDNKADSQQSTRYASETALGIDVDNDRPSSTTIGDFEIFALALPRRKGCHDGRNLEKGSRSISGDASASLWTPLPPRQPIGLNNRFRTSHSSPSRIVP